MKKQNLLKFLMMALLMGSGINYVSAQIPDFDKTVYYQILINNFEGKDVFALGVADDNEEACLQQMVRDSTDSITLQHWVLTEVDQSAGIYHIVNAVTGKALGESSWRNVPEEGADQPTSTSPTGGFNWNGVQPGVVQLTNDRYSDRQQWILHDIVDTSLVTNPLYPDIYQVQANWDLDSAKYWNFWNSTTGIGEGRKNIAIFPTVVAESDRIGLRTNYYCFYFVATTTKIPTSLKQIAANNPIHVYAHNGFARISGDIQGKLVLVYNMQGQLMFNSIASGSEINVKLNNEGVYIVKAGYQVNKFVLK
jgi:hypothetical protein